MSRTLIRAGAALSCALALSACNTTGSSIGSAVGSVIGGAVGTVATSRIDPATRGEVDLYTRATCAVIAEASSLDRIKAASNGFLTIARDLATAFCVPFLPAAAYAAERRGPPLPPRRPRKGQTVTGTAVVNGQAVPVTGTVVQ